MPAKNQMDPESRNSRVLQWYKDHPGFHRCVTVAQAMGETTHDVAACSWFLTQGGYLTRHKLDVGRKTPVTHYGVAAAYSPPKRQKAAEPEPEQEAQSA